MLQTVEDFLTGAGYQNVVAELVQLKPQVKFVEHASYEAALNMSRRGAYEIFNKRMG
ncbi:hypothetical protein [Paenibacillus pabuli]|uniref:hypothetical protein n=1 Tax=Paenibacillus pabuli TaxID=1472 RepID=UPI0012FC7EA0|nr:hypothetical protein [Paenibacillus pabuli]MEC0126547.1 hypothetical protein [Paenibacillus pabuli]